VMLVIIIAGLSTIEEQQVKMVKFTARQQLGLIMTMVLIVMVVMVVMVTAGEEQMVKFTARQQLGLIMTMDDEDA
jgi:hypothetical protein